jgi:hypothetical protein
MADDTVSVKIAADASGVAPGIDAAKAAMGGLGESVASASAQMRASFTTVSASVREMGVTIRETAQVVGEAREIVMGFGEALIAAFAVEKVIDWTKEMAEGAEKTKHLSEQFGMTTDQVQQFGGIAAATGIPLNALTKGMGILDKNAVAAAAGVGPVAKAFEAVGISANDGRTQMERMLLVADKFKDMADGPNKVALAMLLFGRSGRELIPVLNLGAEGLAKINEKTAEYGAVNADAVEKGVALAESVNESKLAIQGVSNVMTDAFAPMLKAATDGLNEMIKGFIDSYREGGVVAAVLTTVSGVCEVAGAVFAALGEIIGTLWEMCVEAFKAIGEAVGFTFGKETPTAGQIARGVFNDLIDIVVIAKDILIVAFTVIGAAVSQMAIQVKTACQVAYDALTFNWGNIQSDWDAGTKAIADVAVTEMHRVTDAVNEAHKAMIAFSKDENVNGGKETGIKEAAGAKDFSPDLTKTPKAKKPKKEKADPGDKDNSATTDLEEAKTAAKAAEQIAADNAKTLEELAKLSAEKQIAAIDTAERSGVITKKQAVAQKASILAMEVQAALTAVDTIYNARITEIRAEEDGEVASLRAKQTAIDKSTKDYATKYQNLQNQIEAMQQKADSALQVLAVQHENRLTVIKAKGLADRDRLLATSVKNENKYFQDIAKSFGDSIGKMLTFQQGFMATLHQGWMGLVKVAENAISQIVSSFLIGLEKQGIAATVAHEKQTIIDAKSAATGAWKATVGIPVIGPILAPIAAATAFAGVMAFSAEGGMGNVPYDDAPFLLHKNEMVLPADLASRVRAMTGGSGGSGFDLSSPANSNGGDTHNWYISALDGHSVKRMLMDNRGAVADALRGHVRYGGR